MTAGWTCERIPDGCFVVRCPYCNHEVTHDRLSAAVRDGITHSEVHR